MRRALHSRCQELCLTRSRNSWVVLSKKAGISKYLILSCLFFNAEFIIWWCRKVLLLQISAVNISYWNKSLIVRKICLIVCGKKTITFYNQADQLCNSFSNSNFEKMHALSRTMRWNLKIFINFDCSAHTWRTILHGLPMEGGSDNEMTQKIQFKKLKTCNIFWLLLSCLQWFCCCCFALNGSSKTIFIMTTNVFSIQSFSLFFFCEARA